MWSAAPEPAFAEKTIKGLTRGVDYWFAVTAYDNETPRLEGGYSNEVKTNGAPGATKNAKLKVVVMVEIQQ